MTLANFINEETLNTPPSSPSESPQAIRGSGGGLSDMVPAEISDTGQPASLSEGEFVWPADVVSMLGDGSTEAGARVLNNLMSHIRKAKQGGGNGNQAKSVADLLGA